ncbi:MAG: hypothetical protein HY566_01540, partial [Candidatus Kerfeldbacteria bacterium]|nr:hypothetical protein [Candidatus Kerfeldbacteria bacterium]
KQQLVVVPTKTAFHLLQPLLVHHFPHRVIALDSDAPKAQFWAHWQRVREERAAVILTTKRGIFAPFRALATVYIDSVTDDSHKQWDQDPRYDARAVARTLAEQFGAQLVLLDAAPSLAIHDDRRIATVSFPHFAQKRCVVDMRRAARSTGPLSGEAQAFLQKKSFPMLVFFNRVGYARVTECAECRWHFACFSCGTHLVYYAGTQAYECSRCRTKAVLPSRCPRCGSTRLRPRSWGLERLEEIVRSALPHSRVLRYDRTTRASSIVDADVVIATEQLLTSSRLPNFQSILIPSLDNMLQPHEYAAAERAYLILERSMALGAEHSTVLLQTYDPEQMVVRAIVQHEPELLYGEERKLRKTLLLPPKATLIKLLLRSTTPQTAERKARLLTQHLQKSLGRFVRLEGPFVPRTMPTATNRRILLLRLLGHDIPATLQRELSELSHEWHVDPDPLTLDI